MCAPRVCVGSVKLYSKVGQAKGQPEDIWTTSLFLITHITSFLASEAEEKVKYLFIKVSAHRRQRFII